MGIQYKAKKEITKRYKSLRAEDLEDNRGRVDCFTCLKCGYVTKTEIKDRGSIPHGIICPMCGDEAMSSEFHDLKPSFGADYLWVRPTLEDCLSLCEQPFVLNYHLSGGLKRVKNESERKE